MAQRSLGCNEGPALSFAGMNRLLFPVSPTMPNQCGGLVAREPPVARITFGRQRHPNNAAMKSLIGMMVDGGAKGL
jgi:hypothetical protein